MKENKQTKQTKKFCSKDHGYYVGHCRPCLGATISQVYHLFQGKGAVLTNVRRATAKEAKVVRLQGKKKKR